jgi:hypothetical protein
VVQNQHQIDVTAALEDTSTKAPLKPVVGQAGLEQGLDELAGLLH